MTLPSPGDAGCHWPASGKTSLRDPGHGERIGDAGEDGEGDEHDEGGAKLREHVSVPQAMAEGVDDDVDDLDADERHDEAAEAVDEQVAAQEARAADAG